MALSSCSAVWKNEYLVPVPPEAAVESNLFDWETRIYGGPSIGRTKPDVFAIDYKGAFVFVYPRLLHDSAMVGLPIVPLGMPVSNIKNISRTLFDVRLFDPAGLYAIKPTKVTLINPSGKLQSCDLIRFTKDSVGLRYRCTRKLVLFLVDADHLELEFNDGGSIVLGLTPRVLRGYSPLFSFNGIAAKSKLTLRIDGKRFSYPD